MATMGMMTAIAIFPPELRPPDELELEPEALSAEGVADDCEEVLVVSTVAVADEALSGEYVEVTTTTVGGSVLPSVEEGVSVMVAVTATTLGVADVVEAMTTVVEGGIDTEETIVEGVVEGVVTRGVVVELLSVTVTVVVGEVVKLMDVVVLSVTITEPVAESVAESVTESVKELESESSYQLRDTWTRPNRHTCNAGHCR
jgi:hypothetical protein